MITTALAWLAGRPSVFAGILVTLALTLAGAGIQTLRVASWKADYYKLGSEYAQNIAQIDRKARQDTEAARAEGERRFTEQERIVNDAIKVRDSAAGDLVRAVTAGSKLQERTKALVDELRAAATHTAIVESQAAAATTDLLTYMFGRLREAENGTIEFADSAHGAGLTCQAEYDSLITPKPK